MRYYFLRDRMSSLSHSSHVKEKEFQEEGDADAGEVQSVNEAEWRYDEMTMGLIYIALKNLTR